MAVMKLYLYDERMSIERKKMLWGCWHYMDNWLSHGGHVLALLAQRILGLTESTSHSIQSNVLYIQLKATFILLKNHVKVFIDFTTHENILLMKISQTMV